MVLKTIRVYQSRKGKDMKLFQFLLIISFLITACSPQVTVTSEVIATAQTEIVIPTLIATPTLNLDQALQSLEDRIVAGEQIDLSRLTIEQQTRLMDGLADQYLAGNLREVSGFTFEQRKAFALVIDEKKDAQRGDNPIIYTDRNGDKCYIGQDFKCHPVDDGTTPEQQTIDNTLPRAVDDEGYTHVFYNDEWHKIEGSDKIQFDNFYTFPWPAGEPVDPRYVPEEYSHLLGLTVPEYAYKSEGEKVNLVPVFFLGKEYGKTDIAGRAIKGTVLGYVITENDPYSVLPAMVTGIPVLYVDNVRADNPGNIVEHGDFYKALISGNLYYLMYHVDQEENIAITYPATNGQEATIKYEGLAPSGQTHDIITGKIVSDNLPLINARSLVQAGEQTDK